MLGGGAVTPRGDIRAALRRELDADSPGLAGSPATIQMPAPVFLPDRLAAACAHAQPVIGAADPMSAAVEELQFALGEGPWQEGPPRGGVDIDIAGEDELLARWPVFTTQLMATSPFRAVVTAPLPGTPTPQVSMQLYLRAGDAVPNLGCLHEMADAVARHLPEDLIDPGSQVLGQPAWLFTPAVEARQSVWRAVTYAATMGAVSSAAALAAMRAHAFAQSQDLPAVAALVLGGLRLAG